MGKQQSSSGDAGPVAGRTARFHLSGVSRCHDPLTDAVRADLADVALAGQHFAPHYAAPLVRRCAADAAPVFAAADTASEVRTTLADGGLFAVLDVTGDWAWGFAVDGHLVGYCRADALGPVAG